MLPKNKDLFADLTEIERLFIDPEAYPWGALVAMMDLMRACAGNPKAVPPVEPAREWPELFPRFDSDKKDPFTPINEIVMERIIHVRGGNGLKCDPDVYVHGPVVFGEGVRLRKGAVVTGPSFIGDGVVIGQGCRIKNSIIRAGTEVQFSTRVAHAVLGRKVFVGANAVLSDRPVFSSEVVIWEPNGPNVVTGLEELGLMAGDRCRIGGGVIFTPAVMLFPRTSVREGARIPDEQDLLPRQCDDRPREAMVHLPRTA